MTQIDKHAGTNGHGSFERRDIGTKEIFYFLIGLAVVCILIALFLRGMYSFLDHRERSAQPDVSPLAAEVPKPTLKTKEEYEDYLEKAFPDPRLETDERNQINKDRVREEQTLSTYSYIDEKAGTVRIPIERAMDLVVERGMPTRSQAVAAQAPAAMAKAVAKKGTKQ
jgi:hypothetical protein